MKEASMKTDPSLWGNKEDLKNTITQLLSVLWFVKDGSLFSKAGKEQPKRTTEKISHGWQTILSGLH